MAIIKVDNEVDLKRYFAGHNKLYVFLIVDWNAHSIFARQKILNFLSKHPHLSELLVIEIDVSSQDVTFIEDWLHIKKGYMNPYASAYLSGDGAIFEVENYTITKMKDRVFQMDDLDLGSFFEN